LLLQLRKFKYKLGQKARQLPLKVCPSNTLNFGQTGLVLTQPLRLSSKRIFRIKLFVKKAAKRSEKTRRKV
jgi:hypothetical protein